MSYDRITKLFAGAAIAALLACGVIAPAAAQSPDDVRTLLDRVDRLQRDVTTLQRQVYQGGGSSGRPASGSSAPGGGSATNVELSLQELEEQLQTLRGQLEEANFQTKSVSDRLDKLSSDVDYRLSAIEQKTGGSGGAPPTPIAPRPQASNPPSAVVTPVNPGNPPSGNAGQGRSLGQISEDGMATMNSPAEGSRPLSSDEIGGAPAQRQAQPQQQQAALPPGAPKDQYAYAFSLINQNDYPGAERALKEFLSQHPDDPLASSAQYWLGRTYYVRNDFPDAVRAFAEGYQKYPQSPRGAENLLYLGRSLAGMKRNKDACDSYARLLREYPKASDAVKGSVQTERKKLACG
ncbi:MAG TPA: tol-pal system protein YbgF [Alphaproteobacteria bacterium]|nr:tol-pal system protein YbgF [Alphaproteobacteria bacterium]